MKTIFAWNLMSWGKLTCFTTNLLVVTILYSSLKKPSVYCSFHSLFFLLWIFFQVTNIDRDYVISKIGSYVVIVWLCLKVRTLVCIKKVDRALYDSSSSISKPHKGDSQKATTAIPVRSWICCSRICLSPRWWEMNLNERGARNSCRAQPQVNY